MTSLPLSLFNYDFPKELIAQHPPVQREDARMMVLNREKKSWDHKKFPDILDFLKSGDVLVMNDAQADFIEMEGKLVPPLPPYIKRKKASDFTEEDANRYRTIYAKKPGSKAAPTAGFHFSEEMLQKIKSKGIQIAFVTLHISYDTYKPIRSENILEHPMHGESFEIPENTQQLVAQAKQEGRRVIAVGTTSVRALESWATHQQQQDFPGGSEDCLSGESREFRRSQKENPAVVGNTHLFILPGYPFKIVDGMLTNFHRPRSTVLVMVSTFAGRELVLSAYQEAIREKYRLFSYGDCMLIT